MPRQLFVNNFEFAFVGAVLATPATGTPATEIGYGVLQLNNAASSLLATPTAGDWYILTCLKRTGSVESQYEIVQVLGVNEAGYVSGTECRIRVLRAQEGTTAQAYAPGDFIAMRFTRSGATNMLQVAHNLADVASPSAARTSLGLGTAATSATTAFMPSSHLGSGGAEHANVVAAGAAGFMTGADKTKLDGVATGATSNVGTVTTLSVLTGNGFAGSVSNAGTTPAITLTTGVTGVVKGNGTALSTAIAGTDYLVPPAGTALLKANSGGALANATAADVTGQLITGYVSGAGVVAATDTILQAINKLDGNVAGRQVSGTYVNTVNGNSGTVTAAQISAAATTGYGFTPYSNLNPSGYISSVTWATPGAIGSTTPSTGAFTTLSATGTVTGSNLSGTNTGDNATNSQYSADYRAANFVAGTNYQVPLVSGTNIKTVGGTSILGSGNITVSGGIASLTYANRANLRALTPAAGDLYIVDGLGLFKWFASSTEPDDGETAFATASGVWELSATDPDAVFAQHLADYDFLEARATTLEGRATTLEGRATTLEGQNAKFLRGTFSMSLTSLSSTTSSDFTATVTGAVLGAVVVVTPGDSFGTTSTDQSRLTYAARVSSTNTVTINIRNASAAAASMTASTWSVLVVNP